jgi:hypothetical protein
MTTPSDVSTITLGDHLAEPLTVGEPDVAGALAVFPLFGGPPRHRYVAFAQGRAAGVTIREVAGAARVDDLTVTNPTGAAVLLYEGEEVLGAQQNRTFDVSILVAAGAKLTVPVSCVEAGRWDGARHGESFAPAPQTAYPELRRHKSRHVREAAGMGMPSRADQSAVWQEVDAKSARLGVRSPTGAMHDAYQRHRRSLAALTAAVVARPGQLGALVAIGGRLAVLDHVSRPEVFACLHGPLVQGYALDALEAPAAAAPSIDEARGLLAVLADAPTAQREAIGLGRDVRFDLPGIGGTGLVVDDELIQLSAFIEPGPDAGPTASQSALAGRIRRPSRRRQA